MVDVVAQNQVLVVVDHHVIVMDASIHKNNDM
jgi:hypothetical protein